MHRKSYILSSFLHALTKGHPRPIELHAHDPIRYIGDMLAWVHQAMAGEREFLEGLFGVVDEGRMVGSIRKLKRGSEVEDWMAQLMDEDLEKICMPLRVSYSYSIQPHPSAPSDLTIISHRSGSCKRSSRRREVLRRTK
jgi:hypothetical protein